MQFPWAPAGTRTDDDLAISNSGLVQLDEQFKNLAEAIDADDKEACNVQFAEILAEQTTLKKQKKKSCKSSMDTDRVYPHEAGRTNRKASTSTIHRDKTTLSNQIKLRPCDDISADEVLVRIKEAARRSNSDWAMKMIYAAGDLHGNPLRFQSQYFPEQA